MKLVKNAFCQVSLFRDTVDNELYRGLLITQDIDKPRGLDICAGVRNQILGETMSHQRLRRAPIQVVESLKNASFHAQSTNQTPIEIRKLCLARLLKALF